MVQFLVRVSPVSGETLDGGMTSLELKPFDGIGEIQFGASPACVREVMSEPEVYEPWMGGNLNDSIFFRGAIFGFDRCDARGPLEDSHFVEVHVKGRDDVAFAGRWLNEWTRNEIVDHLSVRGIQFIQDSDGAITASRQGLWFSFGEQGTVAEAGIFQASDE